MPGHSWTVITLNGNKYNIVTRTNDEEAARELYRKSLGSRNEIYQCIYSGFVHACE